MLGEVSTPYGTDSRLKKVISRESSRVSVPGMMSRISGDGLTPVKTVYPREHALSIID